jgi:hypothetical protein
LLLGAGWLVCVGDEMLRKAEVQRVSEMTKYLTIPVYCRVYILYQLFLIPSELFEIYNELA